MINDNKRKLFMRHILLIFFSHTTIPFVFITHRLISIRTTYIFMFYNILIFHLSISENVKFHFEIPRLFRKPTLAICWQYCWPNVDKWPLLKRHFVHKPNVIVNGSFYSLVIVSLVVTTFCFLHISTAIPFSNNTVSVNVFLSRYWFYRMKT